MGVERIAGGRTVSRADLADSGIESIKRNNAGTIQKTQVAKFSGTTVTTTGFTTTTKTSRAFASSVSLTVNTNGTAGGTATNEVVIKRGGTTIASTTLNNGNTTSNSATFTSAPATWTLSISVTTGTATITSWTVSREASRGS